MQNPAKAVAAIRALKKADDAMDAYFNRVIAAGGDTTKETPEYRRLYKAVSAAHDNPDLPDRYRDPRDRPGPFGYRRTSTRRSREG